MFSTECPLISPIVPSSGSTCFNNGIFQNITISFCLWVHRTLQAPLTFSQFSWFNCLANILSGRMLSDFCKLAKIRKRCCSRILWHFQDFSWVSYLCSSWLQPPPAPKRLLCKNPSRVAAECKNSRFPAFCQTAKLSSASSVRFLLMLSFNFLTQCVIRTDQSSLGISQNVFLRLADSLIKL